MIAQYLDLTGKISENNDIVFEVGGYDYCIIQSLTSIEYIDSTIDGGAIEGVRDDNSTTATHFIHVLGLRLNSNIYSNGVPVNELVRVNVVGRYIKLKNFSLTDQKLLIMLAKIG